MSKQNWFWLVLLSIIWGSAFMLIKIALADLTPFLIVFLRLSLGAVFMYTACKVSRVKMPKLGKIWLNLGFLGIINSAMPFMLVAWAQQHIDSATASILNATSPVFVMILAHIITDDEKMTKRKAIGVLTGFLGIVAMVFPSIRHGIVVAGLAQLAMLGATFNYSISGIYARRFKVINPMIISAISLTGASIFLSPFLLFSDLPDFSAIRLETIIAILVLGFACTGLAYIIYFKVLVSAGATNVLLVTLMIPISALMFSFFILGEQIQINDLIGMAMIFSGLLTIDGRILNLLKKNNI